MSLATVLVLFVAVSFGIGLALNVVRHQEHIQRFRREVEHGGGDVGLRLNWWWGCKLYRVDSVNLNDTDSLKRHAHVLATFSELRALAIRRADIDGESLRCVFQIKTLEALSLQDCQIEGRPDIVRHLPKLYFVAMQESEVPCDFLVAVLERNPQIASFNLSKYLTLPCSGLMSHSSVHFHAKLPPSEIDELIGGVARPSKRHKPALSDK